jgi:hypothetical protein
LPDCIFRTVGSLYSVRKERIIETCDVTWEALAECREGHADGPAQARLNRHLAEGCRECLTRVAWLDRASQALRAPALAPAPEAVQRRARALFRERTTQPSARPWPLMARLLFDQRAMPAFARGEAEPGAAAHRVYAVADREIDIWEEKQPGGVSYLIGQVVTAGQTAPPLASVSLSAEGKDVQAADLEEDEFHLPGVRPGTYTLTLVLGEDLGEETILIPEVVVPAVPGATA